MDQDHRLQGGNTQLQIIQRIARIGIWEASYVTDLLWWSEETYRIFGIEPGPHPLTFDAFLQVIHPDDRELLLNTRKRALQGEAPYDVEHRIVHPNGEIRFVHERGEIFRNDAGEPQFMAGTVQDTTERRRIEADLRYSEERFRSLFASAATGIAVTDMQGNFVQVNPAYAAILGYSPEELLSHSFQEFTHPDDRSINQELMDELLSGARDNLMFEKRYLRKDGDVVWARVSVAMVQAPNGDASHQIAVVEDITEQKLAQATATTLAQQLVDTLENMTDAFYLLDDEWRFVYLNRQAEEVLNRTRDELVGRTIWQEFAPARQSELYPHYHRSVETGQTEEFEYFYPPLEKWFEIHTYPASQGLAVYFRDITERKAADNALRESQVRFIELANAVEDVFWIRDAATGRVLYVNPRYEEVFRGTPEELYADPHHYQRLIHPHDLARLEKDLATTRHSLDVTYRLLHSENDVRHIHVRTFPVYDDNKEVVRSVGVARDITPLVQATERVAATGEQYRLLFDDNPNPMWVFDQETWRFLAVNKAALAHYGYSETEFRAMTLRDIRPPEQIAILEHTLAQSPDGTFTGQARHRKKDGTLIDVQVQTTRLNFDGREARLVLVNDITSQLQNQARIREQAALLDKASDAILVRDLDHCITYWNRSAVELYGWEAHEVLGESIVELIYRQPDEYHAATRQVIETGEWRGEITQINRHGREIIVDARWTLVHSEQGEPQAILAINADISDRKRLEEQFMRAQRMESIGTLAGGIAHDLNNALTPVLLSVSMLKHTERTDSDMKLINMIETNALRGAEMVRQVLSFARGVEGRRIPVDLNQTLNEVAAMLRDTLGKNIRIVVESHNEIWPIIGDPTQIHQLIMNLCVNARDAMPLGGTLELGVENMELDAQYASMNPEARVGRYIKLLVSDTGSGIPAAIRGRIFEPFFTTKSVGQGTGLGLSTVQAIVKSHGGFVHLYSEEDRGTTFRIYLPAHDADVMSRPVSADADLPRGAGELVLVVDDETSIRKITSQTLEVYGYRTLAAEDGAEAVALFVQHRKDIAVVLTDMMMPVMDGYATIQALHRIEPDVRIIAASGLAANSMIDKASSVGVRHFLEKPYTSESLLRKVHEILHGPYLPR